MKLNKNRKLLIILIVGILCFYGFKNYAEKVKDEHSIATQISSVLFDFNTFNLNVSSDLNISDFKVVNQNSGNTIFANGKSRKGIDNDYGHRIFELYYNNRKEYEIGHFVKNNWVTNDYSLELTKKNERIEPDFEITGKNASYNDFYYKRFEYDKNGKLERISFLSHGKEVYNTKKITE